MNPVYLLIVAKVYAEIEQEIINLASDLVEENCPSEDQVQAASDKWHNKVHDHDDIANWTASCAIIETLLHLLNKIGVPKKLRDRHFEKTARQWASIR